MSNGVMIGLKNVVYALLTNDPTSGVATYGTPRILKGAISAKINPNASHDTMFADDGPYETATTVGQISLDLNIADLDLDAQAEILGHSIIGGVLSRKSSDVPPWLAVGFKTLKSNGKYRYTWLNKGKFALPQQDNMTKADKIQFQTPTASGSFVKRDCDDEWERHIDEDHVDYVSSMGTTWFNDPYGGAIDSIPPTVSSVVPANNATTIAVTAPVLWTFSEALALSTVTGDSFAVFNDVTGAPVAGAISINGGRTQVTFTPTANLTTATAYRAVVTTGVTDVKGNHLAAPSVSKFTTA